MRRQIITIDEEKCDGCGLCIPNCPEGALQIIDEKARLVSDLFCDGLGACIGHCPQGAITIEEREAEKYDERTVMENIVPQGENVIQAHLEHLEEHGQREYLKEAIQYLIERDLDIPEEFRAVKSMVDSVESSIGSSEGDRRAENQARHVHSCGESASATATPRSESRAQGHETTASRHSEALACGCPGSQVIDLREAEKPDLSGEQAIKRPSHLKQWPVQIMLVPPFAPYLKNAELLIAADCVPFAYADFHDELLNGKVLLVGCPKLDDANYYTEKLTQVFKDNDIRSITIAHMEVPCCFGLGNIVQSAVEASGQNIPIEDVTINVRGERLM